MEVPIDPMTGTPFEVDRNGDTLAIVSTHLRGDGKPSVSYQISRSPRRSYVAGNVGALLI